MMKNLLNHHDKLCMRISTPHTFTLLNWPDDERRLKIPFSRIEMIQTNSLEGHYVNSPLLIWLKGRREPLEVYDMAHRIERNGSDVKKMIQHFTWGPDDGEET